ncbi:cell division control protein 48 homolog C-like [Malania oleifera]|uniref:cell division control protein 48 homolog C-like n=1 Tax=Malania oleifera TaxID=397392 RepID=UPI0025AEBB44|nr:cell division control protein 48 homolog C-like [Malania oleifera]
MSEQRLIYREAQHHRRRHMEQERPSTATTSSLSSSSSDDETDGAVSTSEDAIYGERLEPEFDLMRSMLRSSYSKAKPAAESKPEEKNLEMEDVAQKAKKINSVEEERIEGIGTDSKPEVKDSGVGGNGVGGGGEVKGKDGPMFRDLGGMGGVVEELTMNVVVPLYHPQLPQCLVVRSPVGVLLHGPPGCGKAKLAHSIANETGFPFYEISATEVVSGVSGASEENIRELFSKAYRTAPSVVFIDEIDAIASKRENLRRKMERRIVTQLMTCMEESHRLVQPADKDLNSESSHHGPGYVLVIGATNRIDAVDRALRRLG